ncbi:hypothetical protein D9M69_556160 [compost metagenome]
MEIGPAQEGVGLAEGLRRRLLIEIGDQEQHYAAHDDDQSELRLDEVDHDHEKRHQRRVEERDQGAGNDEGAQLLKVAQHLVVAAVAMQ